MTAFPAWFLLAACVHTGGSAADKPLLVTGTMSNQAGAQATFVAHLGPGEGYALHYDFGELEHTIVAGADGARQTNFSGQIEPLTPTEHTQADAFVQALRDGPPLGEPWVWEVDHEQETYTFDEVRRRRSADPAIELVAGPAATLSPGPSTGVPITVLSTGHIAVPVAIDETELQFLVDTGAGITVLDSTRAESLGISPAMPVTAHGIGGTDTLDIGVPSDLSIGDARLSLAMAQLDLRPIAGALGTEVDGVLGKELFRAFVVGVDRTTGQLTLHPRDGFEPPEGYVAVPLTAGADGRWRAPARIEGHPTTVDLDSGSNDTLLVYKEFADQLAIPGDRPAGSILIGGVGGMRPVSQVRLLSLSFADHVWTDVPVTVAREDMGIDDDAIAGNLGNGVLGRYDLVFDTVGAALWARVRPGAHGPFEVPRTGLQFAPTEGGWQVMYVAPEWPGSAGWATGDVVTHIDGEPTTVERWLARPSWHRATTGTEVTFTMQDGTTRVVTLAEWW